MDPSKWRYTASEFGESWWAAHPEAPGGRRLITREVLEDYDEHWIAALQELQRRQTQPLNGPHHRKGHKHDTR